VSVLFGDGPNCWCRGMELVLFKKLCCFCHHSKKAGGQLQLHLGLISHSTPQCFEESAKHGTSTTATLAAHRTYKRTENNLSQGCKFDPFLGSSVLAGTGGNASKCVLTRVQLGTEIRTRL
jgi:hypothetical protein